MSALKSCVVTPNGGAHSQQAIVFKSGGRYGEKGKQELAALEQGPRDWLQEEPRFVS